MKTSYHSEAEENDTETMPQYVECDDGLADPDQVQIETVETHDDASHVSLTSSSYDEVPLVTYNPVWSDITPTASTYEVDKDCANEVIFKKVGTYNADKWCDTSASLPTTQVEKYDDVLLQKVETYNAERWSDTTSIVSDTEQVVAQFETASEMYYTASSEVSLLSDLEPTDKAATEDPQENREEKRECAIAGHVAAMREKFESMTRANTPADLIRSLSPSLDVIRNITPSPDRLDG